ncbi:trypsin-like serine protease, partial [Tardiphaga sp.]|uniref:trypsin-like serine protease n=1 Tax=Tardiphaga sp. TaxID=1926292 RepID=UPI0026010F34
MSPRPLMFRMIAAFVAMASPAAAMVGGAPAAESGIGGSVITIIGSRGTFCSGALIAPDLVLTAAHCIQGGTDYKIVLYDTKRTPELRDVRRVAAHPRFAAQSIANHRAGADV